MSIRKYYEVVCDFCGSADHHSTSDKHWLRMSGWVISPHGHFCSRSCSKLFRAIHTPNRRSFDVERVLRHGFCDTINGFRVDSIALDRAGFVLRGRIWCGTYRTEVRSLDGTHSSDSQLNLVNI